MRRMLTYFNELTRYFGVRYQANADIPGVLGISTADFEAAWQSYVRQRYLS